MCWLTGRGYLVFFLSFGGCNSVTYLLFGRESVPFSVTSSTVYPLSLIMLANSKCIYKYIQSTFQLDRAGALSNFNLCVKLKFRSYHNCIVETAERLKLSVYA